MSDCILAALGNPPESNDGAKFYGVVTGRVINVNDPLTLGRVQVQLPFIDAIDLSPWARVAVPMAGMLSGHYFIPTINDEVLVAFEHGDVNVPYVIGCLWTAMAPPPLQSPLPRIRAIRTLVGTQLVFTDTPSSITLQTSPTAAAAMPTPGSPTGPHTTLSVATTGIDATSPAGITLKVGNSSVILTATAVSLKIAGNSIELSPGGIKITATGSLDIKAGGTCTITGAVVKINS